MMSITKIVVIVAIITAIMMVSAGMSIIRDMESNNVWIAYCNFYNVVKMIENARKHSFFRREYVVKMPEKFALEFTKRSVILLYDDKQLMVKEFHYNLVIVGSNKLRCGVITIISKINNITILVNI